MKEQALLTDAQSKYEESDLKKDIASLANSPREVMLFGPHQRATALGAETRITYEARALLDGRLTVIELRAILIVHNEVRQLSERLRHNFATSNREIKELLVLDEDDLPTEVLEGMADFIYYLGNVAAVRDNLIRSRPMTRGSTTQERLIRFWGSRFIEPITADEWKLGERVVSKLVETVNELASRYVTDDKGMSRWGNRVKGARMAADIYLEVGKQSWGL